MEDSGITETHLSEDIIKIAQERNKIDFRKPDYTYKVVKISEEISEKHESPRVIDGDTVDVLIDVGFYTTLMKRVRFLGIDTEELRGGTDETKERAKAAKIRLKALFDEGDVYVKTEMDATGKYGRVLGRFYVVREDGSVIDVSQTLLDEGFAKGDENTDTVIDWIKKLFVK